MTQGRGQFEMEIEKYEEVPGQIAKKIIEEAQNNQYLKIISMGIYTG